VNPFEIVAAFVFRRLPLLCLLLLTFAAIPSRASAHPADMYAQDLSLTFTRAGLQLDWKILPGPFLADAAWAAADADHDALISDAEAQAWVAPFLSDLTISLDSQPAPQPHIQSVHWPATVDALRTGEDAVTVTLVLGWPAGLDRRHVLDLHNAHLESNSLNWFSLAAAGGLAFSQPAQSNGHLIFDLFLPTAAGSSSASTQALTSWTSGTPNLPDFTASLSGSSPAGAVGPGAATSALTGLVRNVQASPYFLLTAFLLSLALGSLHALTPGHGKALVGAYLIGSRGRTRDAVLLGGIVTLTHTGSVLGLGLVTLLASHYILPSLIVPWLELISGVLVILFGLNLLLQRAGNKRAHPARGVSPVSAPGRANAGRMSPVEHEHDHDHEYNGSEHPHKHPHPHLVASDQLPQVSSRQSTDQQSSIIDQQSKISPRSLLALGISGGLVPCPDAIAILLVAVALNRVPFGMLLIVAFSIGLAAVLIAIGIVMVRGVSALQSSPLLSRSDWLTRFGAYTPMISALVVTGLGAGLTFNAWSSFKFSQAMSVGAGNINFGAEQSPSTPQGATSGGSDAPAREPRILYIASDSSAHDQLFMLQLPSFEPAGGSLPQPVGTPVQYTTEPSGVTGYSVSPDGRTILYSVFSLDSGSSIWALNADGSGRRLALDCPQAECNSPVWYPDGSKVAYERLEDTADSATIPRFSIWWLDLETGKTKPVFQDASFPSAAPRFSPDGQWLSYVSAASNMLVAFNLKDSRALSVPLGSQAAIPETWSPDGSALLFGNRADTGEAPPLHVKTFTLASRKITDLGGASGTTDFSAAWSPDGKWIAIDRNVPGNNPSGSGNQVWLVHPDGTQAHLLLNEGGASYSSLNWSPDGRLLLYSRYTLDKSAGGAGYFDVCSTDISSGQTTVLVPGGDVATFMP
jgi:ABC-type nickel/cobalt efflux system permease component RcnA/Tol biopolymer transport system component